MKTDNIYFADANIVIKKERLESYSLSFYNKRVYDYKKYYKKLKKILILYKKDKNGHRVAIDLNTKEKLGFKLPSKTGDIFINPDTLVPFNEISGNEKVNLTKRKIKKLGNPILNELNKEE